MNCTKCSQPIDTKKPYCKTRKGFHHFNCIKEVPVGEKKFYIRTYSMGSYSCMAADISQALAGFIERGYAATDIHTVIAATESD